MTFMEANLEANLEAILGVIEACPPLCTAAEGGDCHCRLLLFFSAAFSLLLFSKLVSCESSVDEIFCSEADVSELEPETRTNVTIDVYCKYCFGGWKSPLKVLKLGGDKDLINGIH